MTLTAVSLFAGVGGFDLAMERNGIEVVATVEIDKAANSVLERRFPNSHHFRDIKEVTGDQLRAAGFVPERGILTGGFPCQDLSVAGRRAGLSGERSGLFWEIARLAAELQPRWLVLENVPGLLSSHGGRDFGTVLGALADLGYGWAYRIVDAQHFGVAQRRRRVFIVGCLGDDGTAPGEVLALREGVRGHPAPSREAGQATPGGSGVSVANSLGAKRRNDLDNETYVPTLLTMREGKPGGGKGPLISEDQSLTLATGNGQVLIQPVTTHDVVGTLSQGAHPGGFNGQDAYSGQLIVQPFVKVIRSGARDENGDLPPEVWAERDVAPTLNVMDNTGDSWATVLAFSHTQGLDIQPSKDRFPTLRVGGGGTAVARTLTARHDSSPDGDRGFNVVPDGATVRRLTPVECERLQGFPDGWTDGQADSARYKQMGNAVAVPCVEWIMRGLVAVATASLADAA